MPALASYHEDGQLDDQNLPISNEVFAYSLSNKTIPSLSYPIIHFWPILWGSFRRVTMTAGARIRMSRNGDCPCSKRCRRTLWAPSRTWAARGTHLLTLSEVNVVNPLTGTRPYPDFGQVSWRGNKDNSSYQGLSVGVRRSFSRGFLFSANYMWSHEIDDGSDGSGDGDSLVPQNVACPACERASGFWDAAPRLQCQRRIPTSFRVRQTLLEPARSRRAASSVTGN